MAGSSVFDSSFQTAIPQLNIEKQLLAMAMRNNALNFQPVIDSLKGVGKVFPETDVIIQIMFLYKTIILILKPLSH